MNDLKLIGFSKPKKNLKLFLYVIAFIITAQACNQRRSQGKSTNAKIMIDSLPKIPITYIEKNETEDRQKWFDNNKYPILDSLTMKQEGIHENKGLDFLDIGTAIDFFKLLVKNLKYGDGVLVYFASPASDGSLDKDKCGKLTLIFVVTTGTDKTEKLPYYKFDKGTFVPINFVDAKNWVQNYQLIKRGYLFNSLSNYDRSNGSKETKHIWFSFEQIDQTLKEMEYQNGKHGSIVKGFGIRFVSYTKHDYIFPGSKPPKYLLRQRLTIGFTFMNDKGEDIGIEDIDKNEFDQRIVITKDLKTFLRINTFDTGVPAPPPPPPTGTDNMAALDYEI